MGGEVIRKTSKVNPGLVALRERRAKLKADAALSADSEKVTANIDHVIGPTTPLAPTEGLDVAALLRALMSRSGGRTIVIVREDQ